MDFFPQFKWAVPVAFSDDISACRFEQGDILYDNIKGYEQWNEALKFLNYSIQIRYPERQGVVVRKISDKSVFKNNWRSEVRFEITDYTNNRTKKYVDTTQGRLFSLLWHGNLEVLDRNTPDPPLPLLLDDAKKLLEDTVGKFKEFAREKMPDLWLFIIPYDPTNATSKEKHLKINALLKNTFDFDCEEIELSPEATDIKGWQDLSPTISFKCFAISTTDQHKVHDTLKDVLYKRSSDSGKSRFDLKRHGLLVKA